MKQVVFIVAIILLLFSCGRKEKKAIKEPEVSKQNLERKNKDWENTHAAIVKIDSYDGNRILESGQGFFVAENLIVIKYTLVSRANNVRLTPFNSTKSYNSTKFVAFDRINDLVILQADSIKRQPIKLFSGLVPKSAKSIYLAPKTTKIIQLFTGKVLNLANERGTNLYRITNKIRPSQVGAPIFVSNKKAIGLAFFGTSNFQQQSFVTPASYISKMLLNKSIPKELKFLHAQSNEKIAAENKKIKGLVLKTDAGDITLKLFNAAPEYRDNFIRLAQEHYFDSLLIHRVISDFGIQSGAADTRYAEPKASVGWKGPGYTIPSHIVPGLFHKRGMVGSPRKPDTKNRRRRSDGSQFYIVSGRKYNDKELNQIEKENNYKFSAKQRWAYKNSGGAPHLDGTYTVFGEVISGMHVVDKLTKVKTDKNWRPVRDIRIISVRILK